MSPETLGDQQDVKRRRLPARTVAHGLKHWARQHLKLQFLAVEAGGGGDCLFLSIAEGLHELARINPRFRESGCCTMLDLDKGRPNQAVLGGPKFLNHVWDYQVYDFQ